MKNVYSVLDEKAKVFMTPFVSENSATAARLLEPSANDKQSFFGLYPEDYSVYQVGTFNEQTGELKPTEVREYCFRMRDLVRAQRPVVQDVSTPEMSQGGSYGKAS